MAYASQQQGQAYGRPYGTQGYAETSVSVDGVITNRSEKERQTIQKNGTSTAVFSFDVLSASGDMMKVTAWGDQATVTASTLGPIGSLVSIQDGNEKVQFLCVFGPIGCITVRASVKQGNKSRLSVESFGALVRLHVAGLWTRSSSSNSARDCPQSLAHMKMECGLLNRPAKSRFPLDRPEVGSDTVNGIFMDIPVQISTKRHGETKIEPYQGYIPAKPASIPTPLASIQSHQHGGALLTLCGMASHISDTREIMTRAGKKTSLRKVSLFDQTGAMEITFWGEATACLDAALPNETVLHLDRIKIGDYQGNLTGSFSWESGVVFNPQTQHGFELYKWARMNKTAPHRQAAESGRGTHREEDLTQSRNNSMNIQQILETSVSADREAVFCNVVANLSKLDLSNQSVYACCSACHRKTGPDGRCLSDQCSSGMMKEPGYQWRIAAALMDETASCNIWFFDESGQQLMGMSAKDFHNQHCIAPQADAGDVAVPLLWAEYRIHLKLHMKNDSPTIDVLQIAPISMTTAV